METEMKTRSIRADEATLDKFKALSESFGNQSECLSTLIEAYEISSAKSILSNVQTDIADYESHMSALNQAFLHILELNSNAEQRIRQEFLAQLSSKDKLIEGLQERAESAESRANQTKQECADQLQNANEKIEELKRDLSETRDNLFIKDRECSQYEKAIADKQIIIESLNARIPAQIEIESKLANLEANSKLLLEEAAAKDKEIAELQNKLKSNQNQIQLLETSKSVELKEAIYDTKLEYQKIIDEEKEKHSNKLDEYMDKLEKAQEKNAKLQDKIEALQQK